MSSPFGSDQAAAPASGAPKDQPEQQSRYAALAEPWDAQRQKPTAWADDDQAAKPTSAGPASSGQQWSIPTDQPATPISAPQSAAPASGSGYGSEPTSGYGVPASGPGFGGNSSVSGPGYGASSPSPSYAGYGSEPAYGGSTTPEYPGHQEEPEEAPQRTGRSRAGLVIGMITVVTVLVMVAAGFAVVLLKNNDKKDTASVTPTHSPSALPANTAGASPTPTRSPLPSTTPSLQADPKEISVVGPTWAKGAKTEPLNLPGWPFSFRLPDGWSCLRGTVDNIPDADGWGCVKTATEGENHHQRFNVMLRRCPTSCTTAEQSDMDDVWFDNDEKPRIKRFDKNTTYAETAKNKDGFYTIDASHYCADKPNGKLTYEIGIFFQTPPQYKAEMQKSLNDVVSQAPSAA